MNTTLVDTIPAVAQREVQPPCQAAYPAGVRARDYIALIAQSRYQDASTCGRICRYPCEAECNRGLVDEPVAIMYLKRFMEYARQFNVKILAGMVLLGSAGMARYMDKNVPGIFVSPELINELASTEKGKALEKGIEIAGRLLRTIKKESICDGVQYYGDWQRKCRA